jgi:hypothetical protein
MTEVKAATIPHAIPERRRLTHPFKGECLRCLKPAETGQIVVWIRERGWWHDACYRIACNPAVNPYDGLD